MMVALLLSALGVVQSGVGTAPKGAVRYPSVASATTVAGASHPSTAVWRAVYGRLPLRFELNEGQTDPRVLFLARGAGYTLFLTLNEAVLALSASRGDMADACAGAPLHRRGPSRALPSRIAGGRGRSQTPSAERLAALGSQGRLGACAQTRALRETVLRLGLAGAAPHPRVVGLERLPGVSNYFIGRDTRRWHTNVPSYARVEYRDVYPGVDLVYYGNQGRLEYDLMVAPGARPSAIRLAIAGARRLRLDAAGNLQLGVAGGLLVQQRPRIYQQIGGTRRTVTGGYIQRGGNVVSFRLGRYDATRPLVIDPGLVYSTYLGGYGYPGDVGYGIAVDGVGDAYVTGETTAADFPTTPGALQPICGYPPTCVDGDAFVSKLNASGSVLLYSTYLGGNYSDIGHGIAVDGAGNAYVTGFTTSYDFPTTPGSVQPTCSGYPECSSLYAFVSKLNASGSALLYSTFLGGSHVDIGYSIAVDGAGNAYVTGQTYSSDFPTTSGAFQPICSGCYSNSSDAFVSKLNASGSALLYSTFLGGSIYNEGTGIAVDGTGNAYVTGDTESPNFPTTSGAFQTTCGSCTLGSPSDAFVSKLNASGSALLYSTFLGGNDTDRGTSIAVDGAGNAYVTGFTSSSNFPTTPSSFQPFCAGYPNCYTGFVSKLNASGSATVYSTYLGGHNMDQGNGIAVDGAGNAYVTGYTFSLDFPTTPGAVQTSCGGCSGNYDDAFFSKLNAGGNALLYSTFLGGGVNDFGLGIAVDGLGNVYVTGDTYSSDFPTTPSSVQTSCGGCAYGYYDGFVSKLNPTTSAPTPTPVSPTATKTPSGPTATPTRTPMAPTATPTRTPMAPTNTPTATVSISLSRGSGRYKDPVTVTGRGFGASETVNVYLDTTANAPLTSTSSSAGGSLSAVFIAPQAISGTHSIVAVGASSGLTATAPFTILPGAYLLHYQGNKGSTDVLKGAGFAPHETVVGYWQTTTGTPFTVTATTNSVGTFGGSASYPGITFTVPLSPTGQYPVYAVGQSSHGLAHATFTLLPHLSATPSSAHAGGKVTVSGTGYGANETVTLKYNCGTAGCSSTTILATPTTDGNGFFSMAVTLPAGTSAGVHAIGGKGGSSGVFATTSITIT